MGEEIKKPAGDDELWCFSLAFYNRPNVFEALIGLQDRAGRDVNLILFALWLGVSGRNRLTKEELGAADRIIAPIRHDLVEPLRALRRNLRSNPDPDVQRLREEIKGIELAAERIVQNRLARVARVPKGDPPRDTRVADAIANLALYLGPELADGDEAAITSEALEAFVQD
jgi:uncharacterized protein (TIGR02444 family)